MSILGGIIRQQKSMHVPPGAPVVSVETQEQHFNSSTNTATINLTKGQVQAQCVPLFTSRNGGYTTTSDDNRDHIDFMVDIIDNAGTPAIKITRMEASTSNWKIRWTVLEFDASVNVTRYAGTVGTTSTTVNTTITAVTQANTFVVGSHQPTVANVDDTGRGFLEMRLTSDTNLRCERSSSSSTGVDYRVFTVEDTAGRINVQTVRKVADTGSTTGTDTTISAVDTTKTFILSSHMCTGSNTTGLVAPHCRKATLTSSTNLRLKCDYVNTSYGVTGTWQIIEMSGITVQQPSTSYTVSGTSGTTNVNDTTITEVTSSATCLLLPASGVSTHQRMGVLSGYNMAWLMKPSLYLAGRTTLRMDQYSGNHGAVTVTDDPQIIDFGLAAHQKANDTFQDADATSLSSHTSDSGHAWTHVAFSQPQINSNRVNGTGNGHSVLTSSMGADCTLIWDVKRSNSTGPDFKAVFRASNSTWQNAWMLQIEDYWLRLGYWLSGGWTTVSNLSRTNLNQSITLRVELKGSSIVSYVNGTKYHDVTNTTHQTVAYHGVGFATNDTSTYCTNFTVEEYNAL